MLLPCLFVFIVFCFFLLAFEIKSVPQLKKAPPMLFQPWIHDHLDFYSQSF